MPQKIEYVQIGDMFELSRDQWCGQKAKITNYPGLLEEVIEYTWTFTGGVHPYLRCSAINMSLHKFVLSFLYGKKEVEEMLGADNIIEHLDNDGLNCSYDNLHIISAGYNKAKAFTIDKMAHDFSQIPAYITDVYYTHSKTRYQMQIFFNKNIYYNSSTGTPVQEFLVIYERFLDLFLDWLYLLNEIKTEFFDTQKFHSSNIYVQERPEIVLTEDEKDHVIIERDGKHYLVLKTDGTKGLAFMTKTAYRDIEKI